MKEIAILLSTYNSEKYLSQQIDSLLKQTYKNWELFIHDDQSTDNTLAIIDGYCQNYPQIHFLEDTKKRGSKNSFMWLLKKTEAKYYMFCDHDDFWLPEKIEKTYQAMKSQEPSNIPIIVACDLKITEANLQVKEESLWKAGGYREQDFTSKWYHLFYNNMPGCSLMINQEVKSIALPMPETTYVHDSWVINKTLWNNGKIVRIHEPLILYRQHGDNLIGMKESPSLGQQLGKVFSLSQKTYKEFKSAKIFKKMPFLLFYAMKTYYLMLFHITQLRKR